MSLIVDGLQLQDRAAGVYFDMVHGRNELPRVRAAESVIPFRSGVRFETSLADRRTIHLESRVLAVADTHQEFIDDLKRRLDPTRGSPIIIRDLLPTGLERWCAARSRAFDIERIGGLNDTPMYHASAALEALDPFWYSSYGAATLDAGVPSLDPIYAARVLELGPAAYWRLASLADASGHGLALTANGAVVAGGAAGLLVGDSDAATTFPGADTDYLQSPALAALGLAYSLAAWVRPEGAGVSAGIFLSGGTSRPYLRHINDDVSFVFTDSGGAQQTIATPADDLPRNVDSFVVATHDGSTARVHVNGVERAASAIASQAPGALSFRIGRWGSAALPFTGRVDEAAIFGRALSAAEVADLYSAGAVEHYSGSDPLLLDNGESLDSGAETVLAPSSPSHEFALNTLGTADVERVRVRMVGPSVEAPGFEVDTPAGVIGFQLASPLVGGEILEVDNYARTVLLDGVSARGSMTLGAANRHGEYARLRPGNNTVRAIGQPAEVRILFTPTYL